MAEEDFVSVAEHVGADDQTELDREHIDIQPGETTLSFPDNTNAVQVLNAVAEMVRQQIAQEQEQYFDINKGVLRVNTNKSGAIQFHRYGLYAGMGPSLIVKEKDSRGNTVITNLDQAASLYIGTHAGIVAEGSDTVEVQPGASRTIRTRKALWAVTDSLTVMTFDVQEEFD